MAFCKGQLQLATSAASSPASPREYQLIFVDIGHVRFVDIWGWFTSATCRFVDVVLYVCVYSGLLVCLHVDNLVCLWFTS